MSGSILSGFSLGFAGNSATMLDALYGIGTSSAGSGLDPVVALQVADANQTKDVALTAKQPQVQSDINAFRLAVQNATSPAELLKNPTVMKVILTAGGLASQIPYTALATQALLSNTNDSSSLAHTLANSSWLTTAQTYDFANKGLSVIQTPSVINTITQAYAQQIWSGTLDTQTPGLAEALTFQQQASSMTSVDQILGNPTVRNVVTTALGIPQQIAFQDLGAQQQAITSQLDITQFQKPSFVESFAQRYMVAAAQAAAANQTNSAQQSLVSLAVQSMSLVV